MDKLSTEKQDEIKKMSTQRLGVYLTRAGEDEEAVSSMDRPQLLNA
jgi:hypothetical protein